MHAGHRYRVCWQSAAEIAGAVDRVENPGEFCVRLMRREFFAQDSMLWMALAQELPQFPLRGQVYGGHEVALALALHRLAGILMLSGDEATDFTGSHPGGFEDGPDLGRIWAF